MLHLETGPETIRFCYSNPAQGLTEKDLPHIFERFYRGEKSRSRQHGGAGIGLAIVKELVEAHKGTVEAELQDGHLHICVELPHISHQKRRSRA